ncbi:MAG: CDP-alcohol phosphatidyltransferase family protein [Candidatus Altiarchaeota archaeon]
MLKSRFRERMEGTHVRIGIMFSKLGLSPNAWTWLSLAPAVFGFISLYNHMLLPGLILFVTSAFMDIIDGNVARVTKSVSNLGAFLDGVIDRYVEFSLYLGLWFYLGETTQLLLPNGLWLFLLLFGALMPSFITAYADHRNVVTSPEKLKNIGGILERFERLLLLYFGMFLGIFNPLWLTYSIILTAVLANITSIQRIYAVIRAK